MFSGYDVFWLPLLSSFACDLHCLFVVSCHSFVTLVSALLHATSVVLFTEPLFSGHTRRADLTGSMSDFHAEIAAHQTLIPESGKPIIVKTTCRQLFGQQGQQNTCSAAVKCLPNSSANMHKTHICDSSVAVPGNLVGVSSAVQPCSGDYELLQWLPATPEQVHLQLKYPVVHQQHAGHMGHDDTACGHSRPVYGLEHDQILGMLLVIVCRVP